MEIVPKRRMGCPIVKSLWQREVSFFSIVCGWINSPSAVLGGIGNLWMLKIPYQLNLEIWKFVRLENNFSNSCSSSGLNLVLMVLSSHTLYPKRGNTFIKNLLNPLRIPRFKNHLIFERKKWTPSPLADSHGQYLLIWHKVHILDWCTHLQNFIFRKKWFENCLWPPYFNQRLLPNTLQFNRKP